MNQGYKEKRDFVRVKIDIPHEITLTGKLGTFTALCRDISDGGLQIEMRQSPRIDDGLEVHIVSSYSQAPELRAHTQVVRIIPSEKGFIVGLKITEVLAG